MGAGSAAALLAALLIIGCRPNAADQASAEPGVRAPNADPLPDQSVLAKLTGRWRVTAVLPTFGVRFDPERELPQHVGRTISIESSVMTRIDPVIGPQECLRPSVSQPIPFTAAFEDHVGGRLEDPTTVAADQTSYFLRCEHEQPGRHSYEEGIITRFPDGRIGINYFDRGILMLERQ
jgi:hypothetical protein